MAINALTGEVKKTRFIHTARTFDPDQPGAKEIPQGKSMTVPDMALSPAEIFARYVRKQEVPGLDPVWLGEEMMPDFGRMDEMELMDYAHSVNLRVQDLESNLKNIAQLKAQAAALEQKTKATKKAVVPADPTTEPENG